MPDTSKGQFISGEWLAGAGDPFISLSAAGQTPIWQGRSASDSEVDLAVQAAADAFPGWASLGLTERAEYLHSFADLLRDNKDRLARAISTETGKPLWEAATEIGAMIGKVAPTEQAYSERNAGSVRSQTAVTSRTSFRPLGLVGVLGPYNFPGHMANGHIMPALLAGNTVVFKPSELAPCFAELTVELWSEAGLPKGVLNLVQGGAAVGARVSQHSGVRGVFFTGSRRVGETIQKSLPVDKVCALEMGGSSPIVVWDATDLTAAVITTIQSAFITTGQRCSAARRLIVPEDEFGRSFLGELVSWASRIRIGNPDDVLQPYMGPMRSPVMVDNLLRHQGTLVQHGAIPLLRATRIADLGPGFVSPGIVDVTGLGIGDGDEVLGPLLQVTRVADFEQAMCEANRTDYGLAAGLISEHRDLYDRFRDSVQAGIVNWNQQLTGASPWAPFGGVKHSGNGRPSGYLATDYCVYAVGSMESDHVTMPTELPVGLLPATSE
jgi:succinylglutamic semialdehyde dehydrogenase